MFPAELITQGFKCFLALKKVAIVKFDSRINFPNCMTDSFAANTGLMNEMAERQNAMIVYAEHRYYGETLPFGKDSFTKDNIQFLTVENALADFANVILALKETHKGTSYLVVYVRKHNFKKSELTEGIGTIRSDRKTVLILFF